MGLFYGVAKCFGEQGVCAAVCWMGAVRDAWVTSAPCGRFLREEPHASGNTRNLPSNTNVSSPRMPQAPAQHMISAWGTVNFALFILNESQVMIVWWPIKANLFCGSLSLPRSISEISEMIMWLWFHLRFNVSMLRPSCRCGCFPS